MKLAPETVNSLYRDLSSGKPPQKTELDHLIGRMIEMGRAGRCADAVSRGGVQTLRRSETLRG